METWIDEKGWDRMRHRLPGEYRWEAQMASKKNKKGRAKGGMVVGIRGSIEKEEEAKEEIEGMMTVRVVLGEVKWRIVGVYMSGGVEGKEENLRRWMEDREERRIGLIGGDFNARTGEKGGGVRGEEEEGGGRTGRKEVEGQDGEWRGEENVRNNRGDGVGDFQRKHGRG